MIKLILILTLLFTTISIQAQTAGGPHNYVKQQFDVLEYNPVITIHSPSSRIVSGVSNIKIEWETPSLDNKFYFHNEDLTIDSVFYDGERAFVQKIVEQDPYNEYLSLSPTNINKIGTVQIYYSGKMTGEGGNSNWGGVHYSLGIVYAMGVGFFNDYVSCTRHWMPCFDLPSDKAKYTGTFIVPDSLMAISNGRLVSKTDTLDSYTKYTWSLGDDVAATYLLTFAVGKFSEIDIPNEGTPLKLYMYDNQKSIDAGNKAFRLLPEMVTAFEEYFEYEYPYETMGYYAASTGAMEHQTLVTMSETQIQSVANNSDSMYSTAAHELAHQWFGNLVTPYDFRDAWLNEGLASYAEYVWIDKKFSTGKYDHNKHDEEIMKLRSKYIDNTSIAEQHIPLYDFHRFTKNNYPSTIYQKGALVMALIRKKVGDEEFKLKMNEYLKTYENGNVTTEDLRNTFGDLLPDKFWEDWVYGRGYPLIDITSYQDDDNIYVIAEQRDNEYGVYDLELRYALFVDHNVLTETHKITKKVDTLRVKKNTWFKYLEVRDNFYLYKIMSNNLITTVEEDFQNGISLLGSEVDENMEIDFEKSGNYLVEVVTLNGEKVLIEHGDYKGKTNFDVSRFAAGVYFIYISSDKYKTVKKIMVR